MKIPTTEEFLDEHISPCMTDEIYECVLDVMRKFTKIHVKAALEAASKAYDTSNIYTAEEAILNAYPLSNIK